MDKVIFEKNKVILKNELYFDVETTLDCGQAFRFTKCEDGKMFGIVGDRTIKVYRENNDVILEGTNETEFNEFWRNYFDLDFDYIGLIEEFKDDEAITLGAKEAYGLRVLNQPKFETIISFIISANNNIKRIKGIIEKICIQFGTEIADGIFAFPTVEQLSKATKEDFLALGAGYRADYLYTATHQILEGFDLSNITDMPYKQAKKEIQKLKGVGPKVADCILLYSFGFRCAFPIDVWIQRVMETLYFNGKKTSKKDIEEFVCQNFGKNPGVLQLFLFNYGRKWL